LKACENRLELPPTQATGRAESRHESCGPAAIRDRQPNSMSRSGSRPPTVKDSSSGAIVVRNCLFEALRPMMCE
jgi:hypothetical protein